MIEFALHLGYDVKNLSFSPITGGEGNIEFLLHLQFQGQKENGENELSQFPSQVVADAHEQLKNKKIDEE